MPREKSLETFSESDRRGPVPAFWALCAAVALAAILGRLPAFAAWWTLDDWGLLARAAGLPEAAMSGWPARWLSQHLYWTLTGPLFGLDADAHALVRLLLHAGCAVLTARLARRAGANPAGSLLAGLLLAVSPLSFTPLYWAAGVQELLGAVFALLAIDRWLAGGRPNLWLAVAAAVLSLLAKENGLGLPLFFLALTWAGAGVRLPDKAFAWALNLLLLLAAVGAGALALAHFATGPDDPYALGGWWTMLVNLGVFGWWLASPGPLLAASVSMPMTIAGWLLFALWAAAAVVRWRRGDRVLAATWLAAVLSLGAALPLQGQVHPYLGYLAAAAGAVALGSLVPQRVRLRPLTATFLAVAAAAWGFTSMQARLGARNEMGFPADPVVRATSLSWQACRLLRDLPAGGAPGVPASLTLLQVPVTREAAATSARFGERWVMRSELQTALGGAWGPRLVLPTGAQAHWANALVGSPAGNLVLVEAGTGFKVWGRTANALLYAALTDVGLGHFERARRHLLRAAQLNQETVSFLFDEGQMIIPLEMVLERKREFIDWTAGRLNEEAAGREVGGMQEMFFNLLSVASGRSVEELQAGSRVLAGPDRKDD